eukprot:1160071-Pelagomonas_calceolata.AAC.5
MESLTSLSVPLSILNPGCSDAMAVNLAAVTLRFARPFVAGFWSGSPKFADLMPKHLMPAYYATQPHRMQCLQSVSSLAGAHPCKRLQ